MFSAIPSYEDDVSQEILVTMLTTTLEQCHMNEFKTEEGRVKTEKEQGNLVMALFELLDWPS